jgi:hypothetical protein
VQFWDLYWLALTVQLALHRGGILTHWGYIGIGSDLLIQIDNK